MEPRLANQLLLLALIFGACGSPGEAAVELGTGTVDFAPLADGDELPIIMGIQGGYHFIVHARADGIFPGDPSRPGLPENPRTQFTALSGDERIDTAQSPYRLGYKEAGETHTLPSGRLLVLTTDDPTPLYGTEVRLTVSVRDYQGASGSDEKIVIAIEDPNPPAAQ